MTGYFLLLSLSHCASTFVLTTSLQSRSTCFYASKSPLVVIGNINEALGAALAICARDVILDAEKVERRSLIPPSQPIVFYNSEFLHPQRERQRLSSETISSLQNSIQFLGGKLDDIEKTLADSLQLLSRIDNGNERKMLYTSIEFGKEEGSRAMQSLPMIQKRFSFLGLHLNTDASESDNGGFIMSRQKAEEWGNKLQSVLDGGAPSSAAVSMDIRTHLAMLQSNSLPRWRGMLGESDLWAITDTIQGGMHIYTGDGMLLEYKFNYNNPYGGCDPLMCPSTGYIIQSPSSSCNVDAQKGANDAFSSAYSAMVGLGIDNLSSICIATSVKALFQTAGRIPIYSWSTIDEIVERSIIAGQSIRREDGLPRKMYKEFGYK